MNIFYQQYLKGQSINTWAKVGQGSLRRKPSGAVPLLVRHFSWRSHVQESLSTFSARPAGTHSWLEKSCSSIIMVALRHTIPLPEARQLLFFPRAERHALEKQLRPELLPRMSLYLQRQLLLLRGGQERKVEWHTQLPHGLECLFSSQGWIPAPAKNGKEALCSLPQPFSLSS